MKLQTRGRKLVLQYSGGSPCDKKSKTKRTASSVHEGATYRYEDYTDEEEVDLDGPVTPTRTKDDDKGDDEDDEKEDKSKKGDKRRKSTTISFLCDHDPLATHAAVHFVGSDPDECAYFFEVRSQHACIAAEPHHPGTIGPGGVFALIFGIALVVYFAGGIVYQRTVAHARGWRQLPNHNIWQGIWNFISVCHSIDVLRKLRTTLAISASYQCCASYQCLKDLLTRLILGHCHNWRVFLCQAPSRSRRWI